MIVHRRRQLGTTMQPRSTAEVLWLQSMQATGIESAPIPLPEYEMTGSRIYNVREIPAGSDLKSWLVRNQKLVLYSSIGLIALVALRGGRR